MGRHVTFDCFIRLRYLWFTIGGEVWEIRSMAPQPALRVFGRFAAPDVLVLTHMKERGSINFEMEIGTCEGIWSNCFGDRPPYKGDNLDGYLTENFRIYQS